MQNSTGFQIISIEPTQSIVQAVNQTAKRHTLKLDVEDSRQFNAPVCGINYHIQEIHLSGKKDGIDTHLAIQNCFDEIEALVEQELADGYIEAL